MGELWNSHRILFMKLDKKSQSGDVGLGGKVILKLRLDNLFVIM
jgi:hypothetical protein